MQAMAGFVHSGSDFFITDAGIVGSETTIGGFFPFDTNGVSEFVRMRLATQYASSLEEWCEIMKKGNNGGYANAWLLGDINTNEIARLELGLKCVAFEKKKDGYFIGSNVAEDLKLLRLETKVEETNIKYSGVARRVRWKQLMKQFAGKIDAEQAQAFEGDHLDVYLNQNAPSCRTLCAHWDLMPSLPGPMRPLTQAGRSMQRSLIQKWQSACRSWPAGARDAERPLMRRSTSSPSPVRLDDGLLKDRPSQPWTEFQAGEQ